ncbi:hypothetical protein PIB30_095664 [Stylosanthes scabra]|uniref:Uncharacterized protein n=1 Tax=Stylosanthes scabra TaxID=79078 RepID=A0ABU6WWW5_9FABA|nr:hypothetical protein [Stylosanthes scabra]
MINNIRYPRQQPQQHQQFHEGYADQEQHVEHAQGFPKPQGYGWGQLQQDMATLNVKQTNFFDSIQAQQAKFGQDLHELKVNKNLEEQRAEIANISDILKTHAMDSKLENSYTCWGLQQGIPGLAPIIPALDIALMMKRNIKENKPMFEGMLHPWPVGESSTGDELILNVAQTWPNQASPFTKLKHPTTFGPCLGMGQTWFPPQAPSSMQYSHTTFGPRLGVAQMWSFQAKPESKFPKC